MSQGTTPPIPQALLVAMDFSPAARRAFDVCVAWRPGAEITALHVVDTDFAARVEAEGVESSAAVIAKLRARAEEEFTWLAQDKGADAFAPMIVEGVPFVEIVKIAKDLQVDTAESVLRTSGCPVLCVP
jgi:nucleotide-binding universal stress UspA family protein